MSAGTGDGKVLSARATAAVPRMKRWAGQADRRGVPLRRCGVCGQFVASPCPECTLWERNPMPRIRLWGRTKETR